MTAAPECILKVDTDPQTGRAVFVVSCAWCEKERNESARLSDWCIEIRVPRSRVSHGICQRHEVALIDELTR
jgi:3-methyladenine DNA glycosylase AlkC